MSVAKWRWGTIVPALPEIIAKQRALSIVWNEQKFMEGGRKDGQHSQQDDQLDCKTIAATLKDPLWWVYAKMLLALHETGNFISAWGSGCCCHEWLLGKANSHWQILEDTRAERGLCGPGDGPSCACEMRGRRAPELAHGVLFSRLKEAIEKQRTQVVFEAFSLSDETQRETVLQEFEIGANVVLLNAELKLNFWQDLPWKLCALAVPDLQEQKKHAKEILRVFGQHPQQKFQHRVAWDILAPGTVTREELDKFAADPDSPLA